MSSRYYMSFLITDVQIIVVTDGTADCTIVGKISFAISGIGPPDELYHLKRYDLSNAISNVFKTIM
jgi:hypothetical protein